MVVSFITFAGFAARLIVILWGRKGPVGILELLNVATDSSIPTWYSSLSLLFCSILLAAITVAKKRQGGSYAVHWGILAGLFLLMSIDEVAAIHERVGGALGRALVSAAGFTPSGLIYYAWVVPGIALVFVVVLAYLRFLAHLPKSTLLFFLLAGGIFLAGAIGMEMLGALLDYEVRDPSNSTHITYAVVVAIEESLEMLGIVVLIYALLSYVRCHAEEAATIRLRIDDEHKQATGR